MKNKIIRNLFLISHRFFLSLPIYQIRALYLKLFVKKMGKNVYVGRNVKIICPSGITIGNNVAINEGVLLDGRRQITIGNNVDIARDVAIWTLQHDYNDDHHCTKGGPVYIEDYSWICYKATILPNKTIGKGAVIASCALLTKNVPDLKVFGGVPAHEIATRKSNLEYKVIFKPHFYE